MKFDTTIIGGGLSGLVSGIRLSKQGQRCVIISSGQSALHFSSGSFDLLNSLPDGTNVDNPLSSVKYLVDSSPSHPYSKLGTDKFAEYAKEAQSFFSEIGISVQGDCMQNHYRITPMGTLKQTWLTLSEFATSHSERELPWKKISIFNVAGFLDFYPQFIADEFKKMGTEASIHSFNLSDLEYIRRNPSELRSANIARVFDKGNNINELANILLAESKDSEAIILPAIIGLKDISVIKELKKMVGKPIHLIATMPPSVSGIRIQKYLHDYFVKSGGVYMLGDTIKEATIENGKVTELFSYNHGNIPFKAKNVILATGSYFSQGLIAAQNKVYEPIFDLDVTYNPERKEWNNTNVFSAQAYQEFGVKTDNSFRALLDGKTVDNLYVSGAILEGFNPIKEGCGAGVSILSGLYIADQIIKK